MKMRSLLTLFLVASLVCAQGSQTALSFDGTDDRIRLDNSAYWNSIFAGADQQFSIECWVKLDVINRVHIIAAKVGDGSCSPQELNRQFFFSINASNHPNFVYYGTLGGSRVRVVQGSSILQPNQWYHMVVVYDGSIDTNNGLDRVRFYVNGVLNTNMMVATNGFLQDIPVGNASFALGSRIGSGDNNCDDGDKELLGDLDEFRVWSRLLSQAEVRANMCGMLTGTEPGLVAYYRINEGTDDSCSGGQDVCDASGNGNHGTKF